MTDPVEEVVAEQARRRQEYMDAMKRRADVFAQRVQTMGQPRLALMLTNACNELFDNENMGFFYAIERLARVPVTIDEFLDSREFFRDQYEELWPQVREDLRILNPDILTGAEPVYEYYDGGACLDAETEYLSPEGWRKLSEYNGGEVAQFHPEEKDISFVTPSRYVNAPHEGKWISLKTRFGVDMKLTPEHRVYHYDRSGKEARVWTAHDIAVDHKRLSNGFLGKFETCYSSSDFAGVELSDAELRVMVALSADGYLAPDEITAPAKVQLKKQRKIARLRSILRSAGIDFYETRKAEGYTVINFAPPLKLKRYKDWAWPCNADQCKVITSEVMYWDGDSKSRNKYSSAFRSDVDFLQHAYAMSGIRTTLYEDTRDKYTDTLWVLTTAHNRLVSIAHGGGDKSALTEQAERGSRKYCFTVPTSLFVARRNGRIFITGNTGTAKSFKAMVTQAYQLYCLTCYNRPQSLARLPASTPIVFQFQSLSEGVTRRVLYEPFRIMFTSMPYTRKWVKWDKYKDTSLYLTEHNIQVVPALAFVQSMVGQAIISGILDEVNFMSVIERSKQAAGTGGRFDQAEEAYNTISRRRKSRFTTPVPLPGCISVMSSVRYKGDFLDRKMTEVRKNQQNNVRFARNTIVFQRKQYEVQPDHKYSGETFRLLVGSDNYTTRILADGETAGKHYPESATVLDVPVEYADEFVSDPENALRDIVGMATDTLRPFISQRHKVVEAIVRGKAARMKSWVQKANVELSVDGMPQIIEENLPDDRDVPRFVHIDLAKNRDKCGIALAKVDGFMDVEVERGHSENMPNLVVELALTIQPSAQKEIDIADVRNWVLMLKSYYGFNIYMVSYDGFNSAESIQALRKAGIRSGVTSMDKTTEPYDDLRRMFYQNRIAMIEPAISRLVLSGRDLNAMSGKIDHTPKGSKDLSDAIAGACYRAARSRAVRTHVDVTGDGGQPVGNAGRRRSVRRRSIERR